MLTVAILLTYVLIIITIRGPSHESLGAWVANRLRFPNIMSAAIAIYMLLGLRPHLAEAIVVMLSAALAVCSWRCRHRLAIQIMVLVGQTLLISFLFGESRGIESTDFEDRYTVVEVQD